MTPTITGAGLVTGTIIGMDTITYTVTNVCGTATTTWPLSVIQCDYTKIAAITSVPGTFAIYPNPNNGTFTIEGSPATGDETNTILTITDLSGRVIYNNKIATTNGVILEQLSLGNYLKDGIYLVNISSGSAHSVFHVMVNK